MAYRLDFEKLVPYNRDEPGISVGVEVRTEDHSSLFEAKINTGAAICVFERRIGEELGIDIELGEPLIIGTATGTFRAFGHRVTLVIEDYEFDSEVYFNEHAGFSRNILGRHGLLDRLIVGINDFDGKLYLSKYGAQ
ncbi:hypothetical protein BH10ACI2_BH10ACI2_17340 [soil metagenome]